MRTLCALAAVGLTLMGSMGSVSAQGYGRPDYGYEQRDDYRGGSPRYEPRYQERDYDYRDRAPQYREREVRFDEGWYLRCHPDVRRAVNQGRQASGWAHYQRHGQREGRRLGTVGNFV